MKLKLYLIISLFSLFLFTISSSAKESEKDVKRVAKKQTEQKAEKKAEVKPPTEKAEVTKDVPKTSQQSTVSIKPHLETMTSSATSAMTGEQINWQVISSGGNRGSSTNFILAGTIGQTAVGLGTSTNFMLNSGFWQNFSASSGCCIGIRGNVDNDPSDQIDIADLVYFVAYSFSGGPAPVCFEEADMDASLTLDIGDIVYLVAYSFSGGPAPLSCP